MEMVRTLILYIVTGTLLRICTSHISYTSYLSRHNAVHIFLLCPPALLIAIISTASALLGSLDSSYSSSKRYCPLRGDNFPYAISVHISFFINLFLARKAFLILSFFSIQFLLIMYQVVTFFQNTLSALNSPGLQNTMAWKSIPTSFGTARNMVAVIEMI